MIFDVAPHTQYHVECWRGGLLWWVEAFPNLVTTVGRNMLLDATFKTGIAAPAWYVGLVSGTGFTVYSVADTMASHAGWTESAAYSQATRVALVPGTIAAGSVIGAAGVFTANATTTIRGAFLVNVSTKSGATGTLYGVGDFSQVRSVIMGDVLNVTLTLSV